MCLVTYTLAPPKLVTGDPGLRRAWTHELERDSRQMIAKLVGMATGTVSAVDSLTCHATWRLLLIPLNTQAGPKFSALAPAGGGKQ